MSQQKPPAGWYDDPAGGGGRRYWDGSGWTQRTQEARPAATSRTSSRDRLPDGYMMLNGERVPLGQMTPPTSTRRTAPTVGSISSIPSANRGFALAALVTIAFVAALISFGANSSDDDAETYGGSYAALEEDLYTVEVESRDGSALDVSWYDGAAWSNESEMEGGWSADLEVLEQQPVYVRARAADGEDVATCRILDADGDVLVESSSTYPGGTAACAWE